MPTTIQIVLIAGVVVLLFLLLAALLWGIRTRNAEEYSPPAQKRTKRGGRGTRSYSGKSEAALEWLQKLKAATPDPKDKPEDVPEWLRGAKPDVPDFASPFGTIPAGTESPSTLKDLFRGTLPQLSTIITLGKLVKQLQAESGLPDASEERLAAFQEAVERLLEKQPENEFLLRLRESLQSVDAGEEFDEGGSVQVIQVDGQNLVRVDGVEYRSLEDIPDPELRKQARIILSAYEAREKFRRDLNL